MTDEAIWALRLDSDGDGPRLAVKDCIDVAGTPTIVGCAAIAVDAKPAEFDAPVVERAREQGARIVGKTNLTELCQRAEGINPWSGTPANPLDPERIPGGSSSGSAVAVALDQADVAYGTDTGGSIRVPAACCGIAGLKTTAGRIPTHGVYEFSRTLDTVGPLARDVDGLIAGMQLMEPGFTVASLPQRRTSVARLRFDDTESGIDAAVDRALDAADIEAIDVATPDWDGWISAAIDIMAAEGYPVRRHLLARSALLEERDVRFIEAGRSIPGSRVTAARRTAERARAWLRELLGQFDAVALPTLRFEPPRLDESAATTYLTVPFNLIGCSAVALPITRDDGPLPASLQLVGGWHDEESLLALAGRIESAS